MRFQDWFLPLALLGAGISPAHGFPTTEHLARLMAKSSQGAEKRCPFADIRAGIEKAMEKRSLLDPTTTPIDGLFITISICWLYSC